MALNRNKGKEKILVEELVNEKTHLIRKKNSQPDQDTIMLDYLTNLPIEILHYLATFLSDFQDILRLSISNRSMRNNLLSAPTKYNVVINKQDRKNMQIRKGTVAEIIYILGVRKEQENQLDELKNNKNSMIESNDDEYFWSKQYIIFVVSACGGTLLSSGTFVTLAFLTPLSGLSEGAMLGTSAAVGTIPNLIHCAKLASCSLFKTVQAIRIDNQINNLKNNINYNIELEKPIRHQMKK